MAFSEISLLQQVFDQARQLQFPIALYRLPGENDFQGMIQTSTVTERDNDLVSFSGFIFTPSNSEKALSNLLIQPDILFTNSELKKINLETYITYKKQVKEVYLNENNNKEIGKENYFGQVNHIKEHIQKGHIEKAILSRIKKVNIPTGLHPVDSFLSLTDQYPTAMAYLVYSPQTGIWLGATPEVLVQLKGNILQTISLAGTQANKDTAKDQVQWGDKELQEQQIVTSFIQDCIKQYFKGEPLIEGPVTVEAGPVLHLQTTFTIDLKEIEKKQLSRFVTSLHPTPAIAGQPRDQALQIIKHTEQHSRAYYTGYFGPVNMNDTTRLYVNLRCMQIINDKAYLYLGGGITADSDPEAEWVETELKAQTLLNVLQNK